MLDKLLSFALQQRVFVLAAALVLVIVGWRAVQDMPIEAFPDVQDVQVQIVTQALGQAPEEVERSITLPIEREMSGVPRMTQLRSVSITGLSVVTLTFADNTDDYFARQQVMEKLQNVTLPAGVQPSLAPLTNAVGADVLAIEVPSTSTGRLYDVYCRTNLLPETLAWNSVGEAQLGNGSNVIFVVTNALPACYYRTGVRVP